MCVRMCTCVPSRGVFPPGQASDMEGVVAEDCQHRVILQVIGVGGCMCVMYVF